MFWNSFSSNRYLSENERYKTTDTNSFVNISNNTSPFVSITWQLNETLGFVIAYSRCPTNDIAATYFTIMLLIFLVYCRG